MIRRSRRWRGLTAVVAGGSWLVVALATGRSAWAHDQRPGVLSLAETDEVGVLDVRFVAPVDERGDAVEVTIELPAGCARDRDRVRCDGELVGTIAVRGMRGRGMRTIIAVQRRDGTRAEWIASADQPQVRLRATAPRTGLAWVRIGIEHIVGGADHLAFVVGLLLVLGLGLRPVCDRRLLATISAFTVAHSVTLALAVTGVVHVAGAAVEACIAASVVLVAREATHRAATATRRWPWLVAAGFGLIHGLGFATALGELGLPRASVAWSLVLFNVGVELGQLAVVAALLVVVAACSRIAAAHAALAPRVHAAACYVLGGFAAWWLTERVVSLAR